MRAQAAGFFKLDDELPEIRILQHAGRDAKTIFQQKNNSRPHIAQNGHAYPSSALLSSINDKVDESYWAVMRSLEEAAMLLEKMANDQLGKTR
jgi:hypothetical protein